jgi:ABC-2 type transport system permease protein
MFNAIFSFELKQSFKKPSIYIYFSVFFLLNLLIGFIITGVFNTTRTDSIVVANSAITIANVVGSSSSGLTGLIGNILLISIMATAIQKDYEYNTHALFYTKPITKFGYFFGRFFGSFLICVLVYSGVVLGYFFGLLPGLGTDYVGEFKAINFLNPFIYFVIPNILLLGSIFFSITTYFRNTSAAYIIAIVLFVINLATNSITSNIENKTIAALLDPSGSKALGLITEYWSPAERNENAIPLKGVLLQNRLLWLSISLLITAISYYGFSFSQFLQPLNLFKSKSQDKESSLAEDGSFKIYAAKQTFSPTANWQRTWHLAKFEFSKIVKSVFYIIMLILAVSITFVVLKAGSGEMYNTPTYLVTYKALRIVGAFDAMVYIFILFYCGTVIWREREAKVVELVGSSPISNSSLFISKFLGLMLAFMLFILMSCITGVLIQIIDGCYVIDYLQYLNQLFSAILFGSVSIAGCLAIQTLSSNKYLGIFFILVATIIIPVIIGLMEWDLFLLDFNGNGASNEFSDMNGFGINFIQLPFFRIFWMSMCMLLCMIAILAFARGKEKGLVQRIKLSTYFINNQYKLLFLLFMAISIGFGSYIFYQEKIVQSSKSPKTREKEAADFEKKYKRYQHLLQPRIIATSVNVDLFTKAKEINAKGVYTLKNKHSLPLDTLFIDYLSDDVKSNFSYKKMEVVVPHKVISTDKLYGIKIIKLEKPLQPNDSIDFVFDMHYQPKNYYDKANTLGVIVDNGTFINNQLFPSFGYNSDNELSQNTARKEYGLKPKERMANISDSAAMMNTYISNDADWIRFEATVSTDEGQTAIAPGYLQKEWKKDGRHYFSYKMDSPILNFYSFLSAKYEVKKETHQGISLEIYYNKGHEYNLNRMMKAMKQSLDYYSKNFSPYQHKQVRIIEFPRYNSFAQSFPNTIPFSESIGFILKVDDKDPLSIDVPFYVTAHEVAHQWWAHQVIGANVQGSVLMSETMSQYSALMVMEKEYGKDAMKKFLKYEMDTYLQGRTFERKKEMPLMLVENQQYIHYNKGSVIMYALKDYIGEDNLNNALKAYINKVKFQQAPYTTAFEFVSYLKNATPDSLQYLVSDMFEKITLYENYIKKLSYKPLKNNTYEVSLTVASAKFYNDEKGNPKKAPVNDYVDIGVFYEDKVNGKSTEKPLIFERVKMDSTAKTFTYIVNKLPHSAGIDPYLKLIDRSPNNNTCKFGAIPAKPELSEKSDKLSFFMGSDED